MTELIRTKVLDHGYVALVDKMGNDEDIVEAARMSTGKGFISWDPYQRCSGCGKVETIDKTREQLNKDSVCETGPVTNNKTGKVVGGVIFNHIWERAPNGDLGLLDTLWRKKHATPFEMGELVIEVQAPIMVFREWHRHRTQSYNEFSARYAMMPDLHYVPDRNRIQKQSTANKQGSAEAFDHVYATDVIQKLAHQQADVYESYERFVDEGLAKEVARINTPVSRYSKMRAKGNLRNWFQFLNLRMRPDAQYEIRMFAIEVGKIIEKIWPKAYALFEEYDLYGAYFSRTELRALRELLTGYLPGEIETSLDEGILTGTKRKDFIKKLEFGGERIL